MIYTCIISPNKKGNNSSPTPTDTILSDVKQIPVLQDIRNPGASIIHPFKVPLYHLFFS